MVSLPRVWCVHVSLSLDTVTTAVGSVHTERVGQCVLRFRLAVIFHCPRGNLGPWESIVCSVGRREDYPQARLVPGVNREIIESLNSDVLL